MKVITVEVGETLVFDILRDGTASDLTDALSVQLFVENNAQSPFDLTLDPLVTGRATYKVLAGDFPDSGVQTAHIRVEYAADLDLYSDPFEMFVRKLYA